MGSRSFVQAVEQAAHLNCGPRRRPGITSDRCTQIDEEPFLLSRWAGGLVPRFGARTPLIVGPLIAAVGYGLFVLPSIGGSYWTTFFPAVVVLGIGMAISVAPLTTAVMGSVDVARAGVASGINNAVSRTAGLLAVAILGVVILAAFGRGLDRRLVVLELPDGARTALAAEQVNLAATAVPADLGGTSRLAVERAIAQAFVDGFRLVMLLAAALAVLSAGAAFALIDGRTAET